MRLGHLLQAIGSAAPADVKITGVVQDHRLVRPGNLFVARSGARSDGRRFLAEAAAAGAAAVVAEQSPLLAHSPIPVVVVPDARAAVAPLAARFYGRPADAMHVTGVTGTDGKTSTAFLLHHVLSSRGSTGLLSTAGVRAGGLDLGTVGHFTTPEAPEVQDFLARMVSAGCTHAVVESSSHGLHMGRLDEISYDTAVWTNLTPEHLDYHGDMQSYLEAKALLVQRASASVLNVDDGYFSGFAARAAGPVTSYGLHAAADWRATDLEATPHGTGFTLHAAGRSLQAFVPLPGAFNVRNALAALAAASLAGMEPEEAVAALASFPGVPGRMERIIAEPFTVVVDFAHTGPALSLALGAIRAFTGGRILLVIGAAGERDPGKRPLLARAAAAAGADHVWFTEEDNRSEPLERILAELGEHAAAAGLSHELIPDRREAIQAAIQAARPGDTVLLAGKGVERTLERGHEVIDWDEAAAAREALRGLGLLE